jgi:Cu2+-containing amine oxidase
LTLLEPPKKQLVAYLLSARSGETPAPLERKASGLVSFALPDRTLYTEYVVSLTAEKVTSASETLAGDHAPLDADEMTEAEEWLLNDPEFIEVVKKLQLPAGATVVADSWPVSIALWPDLLPWSDGCKADCSTAQTRSRTCPV